MRLDMGVELRQEQKLIMTQELQLSVKLLQLPMCELIDYIDAQVMENPLLEIDYSGSEQSEAFDKDISFDSHIADHSEDTAYSFDNEIYGNHNYSEESKNSPLDYTHDELSLWDFLTEQLRFCNLEYKQNLIGEFIIGNIDEKGYLMCDTNEISKMMQCSNETTMSVLDLIQSFEPWGVGAADLKQCLKIQIKRMEYDNELLDNIIDNFLEDIAQARLAKISKELGVSVQKVKECVEIIKKLNPKPGIAFNAEKTKYIIPDVYIEINGKDFVISVNQNQIPKLTVNNYYKDNFGKSDVDGYKYVKDRYQSAVWMIHSIEQRMETIKKVTAAIASYQADYFKKNGELKPLTLKQIAEMVDIHESTVSRAVNGKYALTPKGVFELKYFFVKGIQNSDGDDISSIKIKNKIKELITNENKQKPYSDAKLCDLLNSLNIDISRRTIAKYREEIGIPSSSKRKV